MKKVERIIGLLALLGIALKFMGVVGANILTVLTLSFLSWFYLLGFLLFNKIRLRHIFLKESYNDIPKKRLIGSICFGISLSSLIMWGLFKLMLWPGSYLLFGLIILSVFLVYALIMNSKTQDPFYPRILKRIAIVGSIAVTMYAIPEKTLVDIYYGNYPEYAEILKKTLDDPDNVELQDRLDQAWKDRKRDENSH